MEYVAYCGFVLGIGAWMALGATIYTARKADLLIGEHVEALKKRVIEAIDKAEKATLSWDQYRQALEANRVLETAISENNAQTRAVGGRLESQAAIVAAHQKRLDEHESRFKAEHEWAEAELAKLTPCPHDAAVQKTNAEIDRSRVARLEAAVNSLDRRLLDVSVWMRNKIPSVPKPKKKAVKKKPAKKKRAKR